MIELKQLEKSYGTVQALKGLSLNVPRGSLYGLLGPNGAGKTTVLRIVSTMLKPSHGSVTVAGYDTLKQPQEVRRHIGFMTAQTALYDRLTPIEMVQYIADLYGMEMNHFEERREKIFSMLDMQNFSDRRIARLSSGMKQKTSIARTIIHDPDVVVFDPETIQDHATFREPNQYSTGVAHVFVNGDHVLKEGEHTGATPGRFLKGPGYKDNP